MAKRIHGKDPADPARCLCGQVYPQEGRGGFPILRPEVQERIWAKAPASSGSRRRPASASIRSSGSYTEPRPNGWRCASRPANPAGRGCGAPVPGLAEGSRDANLSRADVPGPPQREAVPIMHAPTAQVGTRADKPIHSCPNCGAMYSGGDHKCR